MATQKITNYHAGLTALSAPDGTENVIINKADGTDAKITAKALLAETLKRIQGTSDESTAFRDPFIYLGNFASYAAAMDAVDGLDYTNDKYEGQLRFTISGVNVVVNNYYIYGAEKRFLQTIEGALTMKDGEFASEYTFNKYWRYCKQGSFSAWQNVFADINTSIAAVQSEAKTYTDESCEELNNGFNAALSANFKNLGKFTTSAEGEAALAKYENVFGATAVFFTYTSSTPNAQSAFAFQTIKANVAYQCLMLGGSWHHRTVTANSDQTTTASAWTSGIA